MSIHFRFPRFKRLRSLLRRDQLDLDLDAELQFHLEQKILDLVASGVPPGEARRRARLEFGSLVKAREASRDTRGTRLLEDFAQDIRYALRMLRKSPAFTVVAVLTLALGIGANTAIFSAVNGIWLEPLVNARFSGMVTVDLLSIPEIHAIQEQSNAFEDTAIFQGYSCIISGGGAPVEAMNTYVSDDFFPMLGVKPLLGRIILPGETQPGHDLVAVLSYGLWMDEFGGDSRIVGRSITVDQKPYTVIGVMPKGFDLGVNWGGGNPGVWMPSAFPLSDPESRGRFSSFVARLKPGVSVRQVELQLDSIYARLKKEYPNQYPEAAERYGRYGWLVTQGIQGRPGLFAPVALFLLFAAVGFVLLMACVNVAALSVGRSWARQQELAIRRTLGATRLRIVRQLLSESLLLAIAGGALGLFFSVWGIRVIRAITPPYTPRVEYIRLDAHVLWFTLAASLLTAILIGLAPALHATSRRVGSTLKGGLGGSFAGPAIRQSHVFRSSLVVLEVALAVVVTAGGALMARSFYLLMHVDTGVRTDHVITMSVRLSDSTCRDSSLQPKKSNERTEQSGAAQGKAAQKQELNQKTPEKYGSGGCYALATANVLDGIQSLQGIQTMALAEGGVFVGGDVTTSFHYPGEYPGSGLFVEGRQGNQLTSGIIEGRPVTPDFFAALGIRLLKGRAFERSDLLVPSTVAIVSESFAREYIPGNPLGKQFSVSADEHGNHQWLMIVGEVNDVRDHTVSDDPFSGPVYYTPYTLGGNQWQIIARTTVNPSIMVPAIERIVRSVDADAPITHIETLDQIIAESSAQPRFQTVLLGSFGVLGLLLAMMGIYGVISYSVVQRTHEIGVRMALGAGRGDVMRMVLGEGLVIASIGIAIGVAGALGLTRFLRSMLFEITPTDPATFVGVALLLFFVALAACYIPARRAMRVDPMVALRYE
jgi:putative ABC transport system permease protein